MAGHNVLGWASIRLVNNSAPQTQFVFATLVLLAAAAACSPEPTRTSKDDGFDRRSGREDPDEEGHAIELAAPGNVGVKLVDPPTSNPEARDEIAATVLNTGSEPAQAEVFVVATGLDAQRSRRSVGVLELEPGHEVEISVAVDDIPVQTVGHAGHVRFEAIVDRGENLLASRSERAYLDFTDAFAQTWVYDVNGAVRRNAVLAESGPAEELLGRFLDESGQWRDVSVEEASQGPVSWTPSEGPPKDFNPPQPPPGSEITTEICGLWMSAYVDDEFGEDLLSAPFFQVSRASYASATIRSATGPTVYWSGHLDDDGCAPPIELAPGNYELVLRSSFEGPQGQDIDVLFNYLIIDGPQGEYVTDFSLGFEVDPAFGTDQSQYLYTSDTQVSNVGAIVSTLLARADNGLRAGDFSFHTNVSCPTLPGNSCVFYPDLYVGTGPWGTTDDEWKFVVAHEIGHLAQGAAYAAPSSNGYDAVSDPNSECRCDHVTVSNQLHCLQSLEDVGKAQTEGFAHYFAARTFNTQGNDCVFAYYKEFLTPKTVNGTTIDVIASPPLPIDCAVPHQWRSTHCAETEDAGTELDWLTAYRALEMGGVTIDELYSVYDEACPGIGCGNDYIRWNDLAQAAEVVFGSPTHPKALLFSQVGTTHDVN